MSLENIIGRTVSKWMEAGGNYSDVVISSRIRLARNLENYPFPTALSEFMAQKVMEEVENALALAPGGSGNFQSISLSAASDLERFVLVEKHLISPQHAGNPLGRGVVIKDDQSVSIMVNEEDHLRIQCLLPGLNLEDAWTCASQIDDILEASLDIAFSEKNGYLTACPTNVGTGLRASAMVHLPALVLTNQVGRVLGLLPQLGLAVRGLYGEGSEAVGNLFQISNQVTLGKSEEDILTNLSAVTSQIVDKEREARQALLQEAKAQLEDRVWRAYGILGNARLLPFNEGVSLLSDWRLGIDLNLLKDARPEAFNELVVITSPAYMQYLSGHGMDSEDQARANLIRSRLDK